MSRVTLTEKLGSLLAKDAHQGFSGSTMYPSTMSRAVLGLAEMFLFICEEHYHHLLELPLKLGVIGHLQDALLLQLLVQVAQLAHVFIQLFLRHYSSSCDRLKSPYLAIAGNCCMELSLEVVVQLVVGGQPLRQRCSRLHCDVAHLFCWKIVSLWFDCHPHFVPFPGIELEVSELTELPAKHLGQNDLDFKVKRSNVDWRERRRPIPSSRQRILQGEQSQTGCPAVGSLPSLPANK